MNYRNSRGFSIVLLVLLLFMVVVIGVGGWFGWRLYRNASQPRVSLVGVKTKAELIAFTHRQLPSIYAHITALDDTIGLVTEEIDRLSGIARQYPAQKTLLNNESAKLQSVKTDLTDTLRSTLMAAETLYVTYLMDPGKGLGVIKKERNAIRRRAQETLRRHTSLSRRLRQNQPKGLMDKLLALVGK